jgi:hypothetical protein
MTASQRTIFLCHPQLFTEDARGWSATAPMPQPKYVQHVQLAPAAAQSFPNRATRWVYANLGPICGTRLAVHDGTGLRVIDMLVRRRSGGCVAVFFLFGDGSDSLYRRAVRFVRATKLSCARQYAFEPDFLLMHITQRGIMRRKWL